MSSGGGPRAKGSGLMDEGKFRQRVEDHYKIMAAAKKTIRNAGVVHNFCALSLCIVAGIGVYTFVNEDFSDEATGSAFVAGTGLLVALISGSCWLASKGASGAKDAEKPGQSYAGRVRMLLCALLVTAAMAASAIIGGVLPPPPVPIGYAAAGLNAVGGAGAIMGLYGAGQLQRGFAIQRSKGAKAQ